MARLRLTPKNIKEQAENAPAGTIVHADGSKTCERRLNETDTVVDGNITYVGAAYHIENVTCLHCRKEYFDTRREHFKTARS